MREPVLIHSILIDGQNVGFFRLGDGWLECEDGMQVVFQLLQTPYAGEILIGQRGKVTEEGRVFSVEFDSANVERITRDEHGRYLRQGNVGKREYAGCIYAAIPPGLDTRGMLHNIIEA